MKLLPLALEGTALVETPVFRDARGAFLETWNERRLREAGLAVAFVQDNMSLSVRHTLRGLHYQIEHAQGKLVRVVRGRIFDVMVDLRRSSPTFGRSVSVTLDADEQRALWVAPGFAHGFLALADDTWVQYKVTDYWSPSAERILRYDDPALAIDWPLPAGTSPVISERDRTGVALADCETFA